MPWAWTVIKEPSRSHRSVWITKASVQLGKSPLYLISLQRTHIEHMQLCICVSYINIYVLLFLCMLGCNTWGYWYFNYHLRAMAPSLHPACPDHRMFSCLMLQVVSVMFPGVMESTSQHTSQKLLPYVLTLASASLDHSATLLSKHSDQYTFLIATKTK